jgi:hypothetical protein
MIDYLAGVATFYEALGLGVDATLQSGLEFDTDLGSSVPVDGKVDILGSREPVKWGWVGDPSRDEFGF